MVARAGEDGHELQQVRVLGGLVEAFEETAIVLALHLVAAFDVEPLAGLPGGVAHVAGEDDEVLVRLAEDLDGLLGAHLHLHVGEQRELEVAAGKGSGLEVITLADLLAQAAHGDGAVVHDRAGFEALERGDELADLKLGVVLGVSVVAVGLGRGAQALEGVRLGLDALAQGGRGAVLDVALAHLLGEPQDVHLAGRLQGKQVRLGVVHGRNFLAGLLVHLRRDGGDCQGLFGVGERGRCGRDARCTCTAESCTCNKVPSGDVHALCSSSLSSLTSRSGLLHVQSTSGGTCGRRSCDCDEKDEAGR